MVIPTTLRASPTGTRGTSTSRTPVPRTVESPRFSTRTSAFRRELFLAGVALYWAEGSKSKPYRRDETVAFINSDPGVIGVFLAWLDLLRIPRERLRFRVMIHESADVSGAEEYWADLVGTPRSQLQKTTLKRHNPRTVRKNTGADYRGCLIIRVSAGCHLYRRIEGSWYGIVEATKPTV